MDMKKPRTGATIQGVKHKGDSKSFVSRIGQTVKSVNGGGLHEY